MKTENWKWDGDTLWHLGKKQDVSDGELSNPYFDGNRHIGILTNLKGDNIEYDKFIISQSPYMVKALLNIDNNKNPYERSNAIHYSQWLRDMLEQLELKMVNR